MFGYMLNANWVMEKQNDIMVTEYRENKDQISDKVQKRFQRIMDIYGTRLTIVEKSIKRYHDTAILEDIVGPRRKG